MNANIIHKAMLVYNLVQRNYEQGRQDRCVSWCYRNIVIKQYPMSERTFWRYMKIAKAEITKNKK